MHIFPEIFRLRSAALRRKVLGVVTITLAAVVAHAQAPYAGDPYLEVLKTAQAEQKKGNIPAAYKALRQYMVPRDPQSIPAEMTWYAAQLAYLAQDPEIATKYYERAYERLNKDEVFVGDYGSFLMNQRQYKRAVEILKPQQQSTLNRFYLAKSYYWQGNYLKAQAITKKFSPEERQYDYIKAFLLELDLAKSTRLEADLNYHTDDQPLQYTQETFRVAKKFNNFLEPLAEVNLSQFRSDTSTSNASVIRLGNRFRINPIRTDLTVRLGSFGLQQSSDFLYQVQLRTQVSKKFSLEAALGKEPYLYTTASAQSLLTYDDKSVALNLESRRLLGRFQYSNNHFSDNNINNTSLWLLVPVLNKKAVKIRIGYAFQRSDADSSRYVPKTYPSGLEQNIVGVYNPYFTPANQQIHSALLQVLASPTPRISASVTASLPLSAQIDNPYLYNFYDAAGSMVVKRGFERTAYHPVEIKVSAGYKISDYVRLAAGYQFANLFFYKGHLLNFSTSISF